MLNRVTVTGRLTRDPDLRYTTGGKSVCTLRIAVDRQRTNGGGKRDADFFDVVVWDGLAEVCGNHLARGRLVGIDGRLQNRPFEHEGQKRVVTEIIANSVVFLDAPQRDASTEAAAAGAQ